MYKNKDIKELDLDKIELWDYEELGFEYGAYAVKDFLENAIKSYDNYLVFAFNCRWNGASGYRICDDLLDCVRRGYDCEQYVKAISKGNKAILLQEFHHDVPMGHYVAIIGLTDSELKKIDGGDFFEINKFANKYLDTLLTLSA